MDAQQEGGMKRFLKLENIPFILLAAFVALIPLFVIFSPFMSTQFGKAMFVSGGVTLALVSFLIVLIKKGSFLFSKSLVLAALGFISVVYFASALLSSSVASSLFGYGFEVNTFYFTLLMCVLAYVVSVIFTGSHSSKKILTIHFVFLAVAGILALFQILRLCIGSDFLSFGIFSSPISNPVGKWYELGIFFGASALLSLAALESLKLSKLYKIGGMVVLVLSLMFVALVNFSMLWYVIGGLAILFFVQQMISSQNMRKMQIVRDESAVISDAATASAPETASTTRLEPPRRKIAITTLVVVIVSILFLLPIGRDLSQTVSNKFGIDNLEVRPSWTATHEIFKSTIAVSPLTGAGPNRFSEQWQLHRPDINASDFWNVSFDQGIGYVPTSFVETGLLGVIAWLIFFLVLVYSGFRALTAKTADAMSRYFVVSSFMMTLFFWLVSIFYVSGVVIIALAFFFTGLFIASTIHGGVVQNVRLSFAKNQTISLVVISVCVVIILGSVGLAYGAFQKGLSSYYFQKAVTVVRTEQDLNAGETFLLKAIALADNDLYYRTLSDLNILRINGIIASAAGQKEVSEEQKTQFQNVLSAGIESALLAEKKDPHNFENPLASARVYEAILPVGIDGTLDAAKAAYEKAIVLSPRNPALHLSLARTEAALPDYDAATADIAKALELKWNYVEAIFLQSQIDVAKGDLPAAIQAAEQISALSPNDPLGYFRIGLLRYESKDFAGAAREFEKSMQLVPVYANAKYFLGLSYQKINRQQEAIAQFEDLKQTNPDNQEIELILENLRAGRDPFATEETAGANASAASADTAPEKRKTLPVEETNN